MAQRSFLFDADAGATITEGDWQKMARAWLASGVITGRLNQLLVSADGSALSVSVASGQAQVEGFFYENDAALALTIATANATNPRIDTVVVRLDRTANTAVLAVATGTPAASPVAPTLSATDALFELPLANVTVPAAAGVIVAANVTDRRGFTKNLTEAVASAAYVVRGDVKAARIGASEGTTSGTYVDLPTVGPLVIVQIGPSGRALVIVGASAQHSAAGGIAQMGFDLSGATTIAAQDAYSVQSAVAAQAVKGSNAVLVSGLTPGSNTFTAKYAAFQIGTATFSDRRITVIPL